MSSAVVRDMACFRLNLLVRPQDFSLGNLLANRPYFDLAQGVLTPTPERQILLREKLVVRANEIQGSLSSSLSGQAVEHALNDCESEVKAALESEMWLSLFPGKELLSAFSKRVGISHAISLQNSVIKELANRPDRIDPELVEIFETISAS